MLLSSAGVLRDAFFSCPVSLSCKQMTKILDYYEPSYKPSRSWLHHNATVRKDTLFMTLFFSKKGFVRSYASYYLQYITLAWPIAPRGPGPASLLALLVNWARRPRGLVLARRRQR